MSTPTTSPLGSVLPPSPLRLGQAISSTFAIFRRRLGLFLGLAFVPNLIVALLFVIGLVVTLVPIISSMTGTTSRPAAPSTTAIVIALIVWIVIIALVAFIQIKAVGMIVLLASETAHDRNPSFEDLNRGTKGVVSRTLLFVLVVVVASFAVSFIFGLIAMAAGIGAASTGSRSLNGLMIFLFVVLHIATIVAAFILEIRWMYWMQGLVIEVQDGFAALGNSWRATKGNFWRSFGWLFVMGLILSVALWIFVIILSGLGGSIASSARTNSFATGALVFLYVIAGLAYTVLAALVVPISRIFTTVMYVDQKRRNGVGAAPAGYGAAPAYPSAPGYGQPSYGQTPPAQPSYGQTPPPAQSPYGQTPPPAQAPHGQTPPAQSPNGQTPPPAQPSHGQTPPAQPGQTPPAASGPQQPDGQAPTPPNGN